MARPETTECRFLEPPVERPQKSRVMLFTVDGHWRWTLAVGSFGSPSATTPKKKANRALFFDALVCRRHEQGPTSCGKPLGKLQDERFFGGPIGDPAAITGRWKSYKIMSAKSPQTGATSNPEVKRSNQPVFPQFAGSIRCGERAAKNPRRDPLGFAFGQIPQLPAVVLPELSHRRPAFFREH